MRHLLTTTTSQLLLAMVAFLTFLCASCLDYSGQGPACVPEAAISCTCDEGKEGWRICDDQGMWGECICGDDAGLVPGVQPRRGTAALRVEPSWLDFSGTQAGQQLRRRLTITNDGDRDAVVSADLREDLKPEDMRRELSWDSVSPPEETRTLSPGESISLSVVYQPSDDSPDSGEVTIREHREEGVEPFLVRIIADGSLQDIDAPRRLIFGRVPVGRSVTQTARLQNVGNAVLEVNHLELLDTVNYSLCLSRPGVAEPDCAAGDSEDLGLRLMPGEAAEVVVQYQPDQDGNGDSAMIVHSNDPDERDFVIRLLAGAIEPCLSLLTEEGQEVTDADLLDFGEVEQGRSRDRTLRLRNCSLRSDLVLGALRPSGDASFSVQQSPDEALSLAPGEEITVTVRFAPERLGEHVGELVIVSNDPERSPIRVPLRGQAIPFDNCAVAVARASLESAPDEWGDDLLAPPLDTVFLDASDSFDPDLPGVDSAISRYEWTIVERPDGSTSQPVPLTETGARQSMFLDLVGRYQFRLRVFDREGALGCAPVLITVFVVADEDIHVQMVWTTPNDPDQVDDDGSDVDLHLLHPNGIWNQGPWDCFWSSTSPDWGLRGNASDNPSLDIDDTDGAGPENINLDNPEAVQYRVGVFYFDARGYGRSDVTARVYLGGALAFELRDRNMRNNDFWEVAVIDWSRVQVTAVDIVRSGFP